MTPALTGDVANPDACAVVTYLHAPVPPAAGGADVAATAGVIAVLDGLPAELEAGSWCQSGVSVHADLPVVKWVP